ncbi:hypothetical protein B0O80DRAFT_460088 [Mortierella sp. GBAus27b]|nr:hypothetical protein BGX31_010641 [Mortierella sp. GBA43]KAI8349268.1 hypothetical protein B0O80DRAFT_460088 [Mortierella sp. GBAus27b]
MSTPFEGLLVMAGDESYDSHCYQYATTSYKNLGIMSPALILFPDNDKDIIAAINFAKASKPPRAIAIRTGGHQYSGASSTYKQNMLLDLSDTYNDFKWKDAENTIVKIGVSTPLGRLTDLLKGAGRYIPHGQCSYVHIGGHCQTGGYGQLIRSFGLMVDYILKFRLITADGQIRSVRRDNPETRDLFYALAGGSPGNYGIVTHVTFKVLKDQNHRQSYGYRCEVKYTREVLEKLLDLVVKMDAHGPDGRSADYDLCITMISQNDRIPGSFSRIVVFAQWANLEGYGQTMDDSFFQDIRDIVKPHIYNNHEVDGSLPLSELSSHWLFPIGREFQHPYFKRACGSNASAKYLKEQGWAKWVAQRVDEIESAPKRTCFISAQFQYVGGRGASESGMSRNVRKDPDYSTKGPMTSISWREANFASIMDIFYMPEGESIAKAWVAKNDKELLGTAPSEKGKFIDDYKDRGFLWGSQDLDLVASKNRYFDSEDKFKKLVAIKKNIDPQNLFTANRFCVVAPNTAPPTAATPQNKCVWDEHCDAAFKAALNVSMPHVHPDTCLHPGSKFVTSETAKILGHMGGRSDKHHHLRDHAPREAP